ncbi:hypothetical protein AV530_018613 [Patagioenas fasciata monilis]|uniref:Uncharacterized protein n=1 Tax=Patagioenas fasciata monilis TaxID=372326 RepID=A0A1V4JH86_PATFA|nr:hypothetical protein AV530_018613 [Patagioenas fasciata monilis]
MLRAGRNSWLPLERGATSLFYAEEFEGAVRKTWFLDLRHGSMTSDMIPSPQTWFLDPRHDSITADMVP